MQDQDEHFVTYSSQAYFIFSNIWNHNIWWPSRCNDFTMFRRIPYGQILRSRSNSMVTQIFELSHYSKHVKNFVLSHITLVTLRSIFETVLIVNYLQSNPTRAVTSVKWWILSSSLSWSHLIPSWSDNDITKTSPKFAIVHYRTQIR